MRIPHPRSLAGQLFAMQVVLVAALVAGCAVFAYVTDREQAVAAARQRATAPPGGVADSPAGAQLCGIKI
ncbi:hypothetical protein [Streptomyces antimycoticus]